MSESRLLVSEPWLYAKDVHANMRHLIDVLGFEHWFDEDSPDVGGVGGLRSGGLKLRVWRRPDIVDAFLALPPKQRPVIRILVRGINALYAEHLERGAEIVTEIGDRPWGDREYTVAEPGGSLLTFSEDLVSVEGGVATD